MSDARSATLWIAPGRAAVDPEARLLGLPLLRREVLAAERAGFSRIVVEETPGRDFSASLAETRAEILRTGDASPEVPAGRLVVLAAGTLPEKRWLEELRMMPVEAGRLEIDPNCAAVLDTEDPARVVSALRNRGDRDALEGLSRSLPAAAGRLSSRDRLEIAGPADFGRAEDWLLARLVKDTEGFMSRHVERRISLAISRRLASTRVTPNAMTLVSVAVGLAGAGLFLSPSPWAPLAGSLLVLAHSILDGCDGELARVKFEESHLGGVLDFWGDNVVHSAVFAAIAASWSRASGNGWPLLLGTAAVVGTILSAGFVFRHTMARSGEGPLFTSVSRSPGTPFARMADALARRDFLYLLVVLSAFGKERWFLALAAVGAPVYFLLLLALARAGRSREAFPAAAGVPVGGSK
jgi:1L-myo-inositol 1-phosphate cytidylyltransferase / CDP-L-myo-inositol myo-inositolphosphotransferase